MSIMADLAAELSESRAVSAKKPKKKKGGKGARQKRLRNHVRDHFAAGTWIGMLC